jgi:hypothetical protein
MDPNDKTNTTGSMPVDTTPTGMGSAPTGAPAMGTGSPMPASGMSPTADAADTVAEAVQTPTMPGMASEPASITGGVGPAVSEPAITMAEEPVAVPSAMSEPTATAGLGSTVTSPAPGGLTAEPVEEDEPSTPAPVNPFTGAPTAAVEDDDTSSVK